MSETEELIDGVTEEDAKFIDTIKGRVAQDDKFKDGTTDERPTRGRQDPPPPGDVLPKDKIIPKIAENEKRIEKWRSRLEERLDKLSSIRNDDFHVQLKEELSAERGGTFFRFRWWVDGHPHFGEPQEAYTRLPVHAVSAIIKTTGSAELIAKAAMSDLESEASGEIHSYGGSPVDVTHQKDEVDAVEGKDGQLYEVSKRSNSRITEICRIINDDDFGALSDMENKVKNKFSDYRNPALVVDNIPDSAGASRSDGLYGTIEDWREQSDTPYSNEEEAREFVQSLLDEVNESRSDGLRVEVDKVDVDDDGTRKVWFKWDFTDRKQVPTCHYDRTVPLGLFAALANSDHPEDLLAWAIYKDIERKADWYVSVEDAGEAEFEEQWYPHLLQEILHDGGFSQVNHLIEPGTGGLGSFYELGLEQFRDNLGQALFGDGQQVIFEGADQVQNPFKEEDELTAGLSKDQRLKVKRTIQREVNSIYQWRDDDLEIHADRFIENADGVPCISFGWDVDGVAQKPAQVTYSRLIPVEMAVNYGEFCTVNKLMVRAVFMDIERMVLDALTPEDDPKRYFADFWYGFAAQEMFHDPAIKGAKDLSNMKVLPSYDPVGTGKASSMLKAVLSGDKEPHEVTSEIDASSLVPSLHRVNEEYEPPFTESDDGMDYWSSVMKRVKYGSKLAVADEGSEIVLDLFREAFGDFEWADAVLSSEVGREVVKVLVAFGLYYGVDRYGNREGPTSHTQLKWEFRLKRVCGLVAENAAHNLMSTRLSSVRDHLSDIGEFGEAIDQQSNPEEDNPEEDNPEEGNEDDIEQLPEGGGDGAFSDVFEQKFKEDREREGSRVER